jgi:hypothetical protein
MVVKTGQSVQQLLKRALYLVGLSFSLPLALIQLILDCEDLGFIFVDGREVLCLDIEEELSKLDHVFRDLVEPYFSLSKLFTYACLNFDHLVLEKFPQIRRGICNKLDSTVVF